MVSESQGDGDGPGEVSARSHSGERGSPHRDIITLVRKSIAQSDDPDEYDLLFVIPTPGGSEHLRFYIVGWRIPHPSVADADLVKLRYFQVPRPDAPESLHPTFKKNGMTFRDETNGELLYALLEGFAAARRGDTPALVEHLVSDETH